MDIKRQRNLALKILVLLVEVKLLGKLLQDFTAANIKCRLLDIRCKMDIVISLHWQAAEKYCDKDDNNEKKLKALSCTE